jgi:GT2 family glycosyltransferase
MSEPQVNITVTSYNRLASTIRCLESLSLTAGVEYTLTVIDNNSSDGSRDYLVSSFEAGAIDRLFLCKYNVGVSVAANLGWAAVDASYYVKLDNDVELLRSDWLSNLIELSNRAPGTGTMGYYIEAQRAESAHGPFFDVPRSVGSCILISREVHERIGFWNEDYGLYGIEDSDFGTRIAVAGLKNRYVAHSERYIRHSHELYLGSEKLDEEIRKTHGVSDEFTAMFYFNNAMFMSGVRPVYVKRKFIERRREDGLYEFIPDPAYLAEERRYSAARQSFIREYLEAVRQEEQGRTA